MRLGSTMANTPHGGGAAPVSTAPVVVVAAPAPAVNKTLLYVGLAALAYMVLKNHKA